MVQMELQNTIELKCSKFFFRSTALMADPAKNFEIKVSLDVSLKIRTSYPAVGGEFSWIVVALAKVNAVVV